MSDWISVEDRMPEKGQRVLASEADRERERDRCPIMAEYEGEDFWRAEGFGGLIYYVTHWMPLPDPPSGPIAKKDPIDDDWTRRGIKPI